MLLSAGSAPFKENERGAMWGTYVPTIVRTHGHWGPLTNENAACRQQESTDKIQFMIMSLSTYFGNEAATHQRLRPQAYAAVLNEADVSAIMS
jgi:hypothetical protein